MKAGQLIYPFVEMRCEEVFGHGQKIEILLKILELLGKNYQGCFGLRMLIEIATLFIDRFQCLLPSAFGQYYIAYGLLGYYLGSKGAEIAGHNDLFYPAAGMCNKGLMQDRHRLWI